jgi:hypothetical protein
MTESEQHDAWSAGRNYDDYMGRWSWGIAASFVDWLAQPASWTGSMSAAVRVRFRRP